MQFQLETNSICNYNVKGEITEKIRKLELEIRKEMVGMYLIVGGGGSREGAQPNGGDEEQGLETMAPNSGTRRRQR